MNGDGALDVAVLLGATLVVLPGDGQGKLGTSETTPPDRAPVEHGDG
jgi:hypothetical protein